MTDTFKITGLKPKSKNGKWVYRRSIKKKLADVFPRGTSAATNSYYQVTISKDEYRVNLDTLDKNEALERYRPYADDFAARVEAAERLLDDKPKVTEYLSSREIERFIKNRIGDFDTDTGPRINNDTRMGHALTGTDNTGLVSENIAYEMRNIQQFDQQMSENISARIYPVDTMLEKEGLIVPSGSTLYRQIKIAYLERLKAQSELRLAKLINQQDPIVKAAEPLTNAGEEDANLTLGEVLELFINDSDKERREKTDADYLSKLKIMIRELGGMDRLIGTVKQKECEELRNTIRKLPPYFNMKYKEKPLGEILKIVTKEREKGKDVPFIGYVAVNSYAGLLGNFFGFAEHKGHVGKNVAKKLKIKKPRDVQKKDKPHFTTEQLNTILSAPVFTGFKSEGRGGWIKPGELKNRGGCFWVFLISLHSGMRLNESCQLLTTDIKDIEGYPCIDVSEFDDNGNRVKDLKNEQSNRFIVVHPTLLELGFMEFVEDQRRAGETRLFPEIKMSSKGYYSDTYNKWFNDRFIKEKLDIYGPTFHSTRHMYADQLRKAQVPQDIQRSLGGWGSPDGEELTTDFTVYGRGYPPDIQMKHIKHVSYDIEWSKLVYDRNDVNIVKSWTGGK